MNHVPWLLVSVFPLLLSWHGVNSSVYTQQVLRNLNQESRKEERRNGPVSLAFVFDRTGSMYDDLVHVKTGAARIFNITTESNKSSVHHYILVPFRDPDVGPAFQTEDPEKFLKALNDIHVRGGKDCPEMSITAIKKALELSLPGSVIYVFTDAEAKDHRMLADVIQLIRKNNVRVNFILTGNCGVQSKFIHRNTYEKIATASSGQVVKLNKSDVGKIWDFVKVSFNPKRKNIYSVDKLSKGERTHYIQINSNIDLIIMTVSGTDVKVVIRDNVGDLVLMTDDYVDVLLNLNSVVSVVMRNPKPGNWSVRVISRGPHALRVEAISDDWRNVNIKHTVKVIPDINECTRGMHDCRAQEQCLDLRYGFTCVKRCITGFEMRNDGLCSDIDECHRNPTICGDGECRNIRGSYRCLKKCPRGLTPNANGTCDDINECFKYPTICGNKDCFNVQGSYRCLTKCTNGFSRNEIGDCEDINECSQSPFICSRGECRNTAGSFRCQVNCSHGYTLNDDFECIDIDECSKYPVICGSQDCINFAGSYSCVDKCLPGYYRSDNGNCEDMDECLDSSQKCQFVCENTQGGFQCLCPRGSRLAQDEKTCIRTRTCMTRGPQRCQYKCNIETGRCVCPPGYRLHWDQASCLDVNECLSGEHACGTRECFNTLGKYHCLNLTCPQDYYPTTDGYCTMQCLHTFNQCPAQHTKLQHISISIPRYLPVNTDFLRLKPYSFVIPNGGSLLDNACYCGTYFYPISYGNHLFGVYQLGNIGILYNRVVFNEPGFYEFTVVSDYYYGYGRAFTRTTFRVFVDVANYTF